MSHASQDNHAPAGPHPEFPDIVDDAAPTAAWWSWLGVVLFALIFVAGALHGKSASTVEEPTTVAPTTAAQAPSQPMPTPQQPHP